MSNVFPSLMLLDFGVYFELDSQTFGLFEENLGDGNLKIWLEFC